MRQTQRTNWQQVQNKAGGFVYRVDKWTALDRFLHLGTEGGSFYVGSEVATLDGIARCVQCINENPQAVLEAITKVATTNSAPKLDPAVFLLALLSTFEFDGAHGTNPRYAEYIRQQAYNLLPVVARRAPELFLFVKERDNIGAGRGSGFRRALATWYLSQQFDELAYQMLKYRQRYGYTHGDLLRLCHPVTTLGKFHTLYKLALDKFVYDHEVRATNRQVWAWYLLKEYFRYFEKGIPEPNEEELGKAAMLISAGKLVREMVPTELLKYNYTWFALLEHMPVLATIRNLGVLQARGVLDDQKAAATVYSRLTSEAVTRSRTHPLAVLIAAKQYAAGRGMRGNLTWNPDYAIKDALNQAFHASFALAKPTGKRRLIAIDASGSMEYPAVSGWIERKTRYSTYMEAVPGNLSSREAGVAMAMYALRQENEDVDILGFTCHGNRSWWSSGNGVFQISGLSSHNTLDENLRIFNQSIAPAGTDIALPFIWARHSGKRYDSIEVYTDGETWAGNTHVDQALRDYRVISPGVKVFFAQLQPSDTELIENDAGVYSVSGLDATLPQLIEYALRD